MHCILTFKVTQSFREAKHMLSVYVFLHRQHTQTDRIQYIIAFANSSSNADISEYNIRVWFAHCTFYCLTGEMHWCSTHISYIYIVYAYIFGLFTFNPSSRYVCVRSMYALALRLCGCLSTGNIQYQLVFWVSFWRGGSAETITDTGKRAANGRRRKP